MTTSTLARPLPGTLTRLRSFLITAGWDAASPEFLDPDGEHLARLERQTES